MAEHPLGMIPPSDDRHRLGYPLTVGTIPDTPTPVVLGINWYTNFDHPGQDASGHWWIGQGDLGRVRGGHAICVEPPHKNVRDATSWWRFYDQLAEGACCGAASCRMQTLVNRRRYDFFELYRQAQRQDEWEGESYSGTSVRAALDVLRERGPVPFYRKTGVPSLADGLVENRWANTVDEVVACLHQPASRGYVTLLNSWGAGYPQRVRLPLETLDRLLFREGGEASVVTDRPGRG